MSLFRRAMLEWRGEPFAGVFPDEDLPAVCEDFARQLEDLRKQVVDGIVSAALRHARYDWADTVHNEPIADHANFGEPDGLWLLRALTALHDQGPAVAEEWVEERRSRIKHDPLVDRAAELLRLAEHGVDVHRPLVSMPAAGTRAEAPTLVGRARELGTLCSFLDQVAKMKPGVVRLEGRIGVGKSRLLRELTTRLIGTRERMVVVSARDAGDLSLWRDLAGVLWSQARRDIADDPRLTRADRQTLADFIMEAQPGPGTLPRLERGHGQVSGALGELLRHSGQGCGLIVAIDDAECLKPAALDMLSDILAELAHAAVGFILAGDTVAPVAGATTTPMRLRPLNVPEVREWLSTLAGTAPSEQEVARIFEDTGGLPLRLCDVADVDGELTTSLGQLLDRPDKQLFEWLAAAAITTVNTEIDPVLVASILGVDEPTADWLRAAVATTRAVDTHGHLQFRHDAWREEVLTTLNAQPALARKLHGRAFTVLSQSRRGEAWPSPRLPIRLANHASLAIGELPDDEIAKAQLAAARAELAGHAPSAAKAWAERGLRLPCAIGTRFNLLLTLGDAENDADRMDPAGRHFRAAWDLAEGNHRQRALAVIRLARRWSDPGLVDDELLHMLNTAISGLAETEDLEAEALRLQLNSCLAHKTALAVSEWIPADSRSLTGPELARDTLKRLGTGQPPAVRCEVLNQCRWGLFDFTPPAELWEVTERLRDASQEADSTYFTSEALLAQTVDQLRLGEIRSAHHTIRSHARLAAGGQRPMGRWLQATLETLLDLWNGKFDVASQRLLGESRAMVTAASGSEAVPSETLKQTWEGQLFWLRYEQGQLPGLLNSTQAYQFTSNSHFRIWEACLVLAHCEAGHYDEAAARLIALADDPTVIESFPPHGWAVPTLALLAESCTRLHRAGIGQAELAPLVAQLRTRLAHHPNEIALAGWPAVLIGPIARFRAALALIDGAPAEARGLLTTASRLASDSPPHSARIWLDQALALKYDRSGTHSTITALAERTRRAAQRLGMRSLERDAVTLFALGTD